MPRSFSSAIQSEVAWRAALRPLTEPAVWIAPPNSSSFSVSVVLPASGWEMMAKVRRRAASVATSGMAAAPATGALEGREAGDYSGSGQGACFPRKAQLALRAGHAERDRGPRQPGVGLHREVQVPATAAAAVAGAGERMPDLPALAGADEETAGLEVSVYGHAAVGVQHPQQAAVVRGVLHRLHHRAGARGEDRRAFGQREIDGVAVLRVGVAVMAAEALAHAHAHGVERQAVEVVVGTGGRVAGEGVEQPTDRAGPVVAPEQFALLAGGQQCRRRGLAAAGGV